MFISVAIASFNGEKYIRKQIESILNQTRKVDEIVISDDGSTDKTLAIIKDISAHTNIEIVQIKNNKNHGYCGNFENAIKNTKGDIVFIADQDDVWMPDKVEKVVQLFSDFRDCNAVITNGNIINQNEQVLSDSLTSSFTVTDYIMHLDGPEWLELSVSRPLCNGMALAISRTLFSEILPFPDTTIGHDHWIVFNSILTHGCYHLDEKLVSYRLHGNNTAGNKVYKGKPVERLIRIRKRLQSSESMSKNILMMSEAIQKKLHVHGLDDTPAYHTAQSQLYIGQKLADAHQDFRLIGAFKILRLFCTNMRYRHSGTNGFLLEVASVLMKRK